MRIGGRIEDRYGVDEPGYRPRLPPAPEVGAEESPRRRRTGWRVTTWLILIWCTAIVAWAIGTGVIAVNDASRCTREGVLSVSACNDASGAGAGIGIAVVLLIGFFGFAFLALIWLMTKPPRRICPVCGETVGRGYTVCGCGYDFAEAHGTV